jgi:hypothetical protein
MSHTCTVEVLTFQQRSLLPPADFFDPLIHLLSPRLFSFTNSRTDSALACITAIEDVLNHHQHNNSEDLASLSSYNQAVLYAKYIIYNKDGDFTAAEENLRKLLHSPNATPYDLAMNAVKLFAQDTPHMMPTKTKLFQLLSLKYPTYVILS